VLTLKKNILNPPNFSSQDTNKMGSVGKIISKNPALAKRRSYQIESARVVYLYKGLY
jgi:hypothetical protein